MVRISFNVDGLSEKVQEKVKPLLLRIAADLSNYLADEVPVGATSNLRNSVQILGYNSRQNSVVVAVKARYANVVRLGQDPGSFPPLEPLRKWVSRVIGEQRYSTWGGSGWQVTSLDEATYLVGRKIEREGTDPNNYVERSLERLRRKYS